MKLTDEQLEELTENAKLQFTPEQIAIIMAIDGEALAELIFSKEKNAVKDAYDRGILIAEAELRKSIYTAAKQGSTPSQKEFIKMIKSREASMKLAKRKFK